MARRLLVVMCALFLGASLTGCGLGAVALAAAIEDATDGDGGDGGGDGGAGASMDLAEAALAAEVFALVNAVRDAEGLPALVWHDTMADVAYDHAVDMDERDFFDHVNPDGDDAAQRLLARGVFFTAVAENIAQGDLTAAGVMDLWMGSDGHRANILSPLLTEIGVGVHQTASGTWWVQLFRHP